ncbi:MAG TPA: phosphatase PAP2 family protein [Rhizomicrobium sp.]|nr:phosphatase PAP2 family protein [Rhizomicrobium sp.]
MSFSPQRILLGIVLAIVAADVVWACLFHFDIDVRAYFFVGEIAAAMAVGGFFYARVRKNGNLSAMLTGAGFVIAFATAFSLLNYFLLTVAGPRIDFFLGGVDRAMGVDWPALMRFASLHPLLNKGLAFAYTSVLPQIALLIVCLGLCSRPKEIYALCFAIASGAMATVLIWTLMPSFGAFSIYDLPPSVSGRLFVVLDAQYARDLVTLLAHGPGRISPSQMKGLIGFPSFHASLAVFVTWYARDLKFIRWPVLALNCVVLFATPIQGGHHVIDVIAGVAMAALAIALARRVMAKAPAASRDAAAHAKIPTALSGHAPAP